RNSRALARSLTLVAAAFALHGAAVAADSTNDIQQRVRNLLSGAGTPPAVRADASTVVTDSADTQELARRVLLGTSGTPPAAAPGATHEHGDVQTLAQRVLLGRGAPSSKGS